MDIYPCVKFHCNSFTGSLLPNMWNITLLCPGYTFFSGWRPARTPWMDFNRFWLKWRFVTQGCAFWEFWWQPTFLRVQPPPSKKNGAWLGIFQPNWQNHKIALSPTVKIGSTPNFDRVIEPHSWLHGWSRMTKFQFKIADGRHILENVWNTITRLSINWFGRNLGDSIPSCPPCPPWCGCHGNGHCLATAHWIFSCYGSLEAARMNQFW